MANRIGGSRRKARAKLSKNVRDKGKLRIKKIMKKFNEGDNVVLKLDPSFMSSFFHRRFHGKSGKVIGKRGSHYVVEFQDKGKKKHLIVHPVHMKQI